MKPRKKFTPFATDADDKELFILRDYTGINLHVQAIDGLPLTRFGKEKKLYMRVTTAIKWHEEELSNTGGRSGNPAVLKLLKQAYANFLQGKTSIQ